MAHQLFDDEPAGSGLLAGLRVDPEFAAAFEARKRGQELKKRALRVTACRR